MSLQAILMRQYMRFTLKRQQLETVDQMRKMVGSIETTVHPDVTVTRTGIHEPAGEWLIPQDVKAKTVLLYFHGGGYVSGSLESHRGFLSHLAHTSNILTLAIDYRLAPENPYPAALDDAVDSYNWLLKIGYDAKDIIVGGDSAGGGLTLAALLKLREMRKPLPAAALCLSPWTDLMGTGDSVKSQAFKDPWLKPTDINVPVQAYLGDHPRFDPFVSPLYADLRNLPPLLIHVGEFEILRSDSERLAQKAQKAGVDVTLKQWRGMWHVWHLFYDVVPESRNAIQDLADFMNKRRIQIARERKTAELSMMVQQQRRIG